MSAPLISGSPLSPCTWRSIWRVAAVGGALLLIGLGLGVAAMGGAPLWGLGVVHLLTVAGVVWLARREAEPRRERTLWLLAIAHGALGPFGAAGTLLSVALGRYFDRHATSVDEWRRTLFPETEEDPDAKLWALHELGRLHARLGQHVEALGCFEQVMAHEDSATARLWIMECLFHLRRFGDLRRCARESAERLCGEPAALPIETRQVLRLWAPGTAPVP